MGKVVILAAGLGKRMRRKDASVELTAEQKAVAGTGVKALIPIDRPFLDYVLNTVADAGFREVCLVIGPRHHEIREYYGGLQCQRVEISFAVQEQPNGTADAVAAAANFVGSDQFLLLNSDNFYPVSALKALRELSESAVVGFHRKSLLATSNIPSDRIAKYAVMQTTADGYLDRIIEKPDPSVIDRLPEPILINMNCWRFAPAICAARAELAPSSRGEFEIPDAVTYSMRQMNCRYRVLESTEAVLDLSHPEDVAPVARCLRGMKVEL